MSDKVLVVLSGGLDSTTLAYDLQSTGWEISALSFDYGQNHVKELEFAQLHAQREGWSWKVVPMAFMRTLLRSALTGSSDVPEGHYAAENMKSTVVPNRNAIMLSIACGVALSQDIEYIATAVHSGDHPIYPDCREGFIRNFETVLRAGNPGFKGIVTPYIRQDKRYIAQRAVDLGYPFNATWSCYKGGEKHCGKCGTCVERMEALWSCIFRGEETGQMPDEERREWVFPPDLYEDNTYWMKALEEASK